MRTALLRSARTAGALGAAALLGLAAACSDSPTAPAGPLAPDTAPARSLATTTTTAATYVTALTRNVPLRTKLVASAVIGPAGGSVEIKEAGVKLNVDSFTVDRPTTFTVTALPGNVVAYDFTPEGTHAKGGLRIKQSLVGTSGEEYLKPRGLMKKRAATLFEGGYFRQASDLNQSAGTALIREFLPATADLKGRFVEFRVHHFSGYMVSMGRYDNVERDD